MGVGPGPDRRTFHKPAPFSRPARRMCPHKNAPFVPPPLVALEKFGHQKFIEQDLSVACEPLATATSFAPSALCADQGIVGGPYAVFSRSKGREWNDVMRLQPPLKSDVVGTPFDGSKNSARPATTQLNLCPMGCHPANFSTVGTDIEVAGAKKKVRVLDQACIDPQPSPCGRSHVPIEEQRPGPGTPMMGLLSHTQCHRRGKGPRQRGFQPFN